MNDKELRQLEEKTSFFGRMKTLFKPDDVFWNNEIKANVFSAFVLLMVELVILISWLLASVGIFHVFPILTAPSIFPAAHNLLICRGQIPHSFDNFAEVVYSIFHHPGIV